MQCCFFLLTENLLPIFQLFFLKGKGLIVFKRSHIIHKCTQSTHENDAQKAASQTINLNLKPGRTLNARHRIALRQFFRHRAKTSHQLRCMEKTAHDVPHL